MEPCSLWNMVVTIIGAQIGIGAIIVTFMLWMFNKLDSDIKGLGNKLDSDMRCQTARTDQLYQMFVDLLKSQKPKTEP